MSMDNGTKLEAPKHKTWGELASDVVHNPYADLAIAGGVTAALIASRGKLAGVAERLFPKASSLLEGAAENGPLRFNPDGYKWVPSRGTFDGSRSLAQMAESTSSRVQYDVATHPDVTSATLSRLAKIGDNSIRETVAVNAKSTPETLDELANLRHINAPINLRIATNPSTSSETLDKLATADGSILNKGLQRQIGRHPNTSPETLSGLVEGQGKLALQFRNSDVIDTVVTNPKATTETLKTIATSKDSISGATLKAIVEHPNSTPDILNDIASRDRYIDQGTWEAIARSTKATPETLDKLATGRAINMDREGITKLLLKNPNTSAETAAKLRAAE